MVPLSMTLTLYLEKCVSLFVGDSWVSCITVLCNFHTEYLPVKKEFDITTYTPWSLWPVVFIARASNSLATELFTTIVEGAPRNDRWTFLRSSLSNWKSHRTTSPRVRSLVMGRRRRRYFLAENSNHIRRRVRLLGTSLTVAQVLLAALDDDDLTRRRQTTADDDGGATMSRKLVPRPDPRDRKWLAAAGRRRPRGSMASQRAATFGTGRRVLRCRRCGRSDRRKAVRLALEPAPLRDAEINRKRRFPVEISSACSDGSETKSSPVRTDTCNERGVIEVSRAINMLATWHRTL